MSAEPEPEANAGDALSLLIARASTQHSTWDSLDNKTMWLFGLSVAVLALFLSGLTGAETATDWHVVAAWIAVALTTLAGVLAYREYFPDEIASYVEPSAVVKGIGTPGAQRGWCDGVLAAIQENRKTLKRKTRLLEWCSRVVGLQLLICLISAATLI